MSPKGSWVPRPTHQSDRPSALSPTERNYDLVCKLCKEKGQDVRWSDGTKMSVLQLHQQLEHPDAPTPSVQTVWVGKGPDPNSGGHPVENRASRRREAQRKRKKGR